MTNLLPADTRQALNKTQQIDNRSLYFDRFADPTLRDDTKRSWFEKGAKILVCEEAQKRARFPSAVSVKARLMSRLMVNMSGGVMENAGLCLDRYGLPYIPGSAVKGCARRMALQALHDWVHAGTEALDSQDISVPCRASFAKPAEMLVAICTVFGWVEQDWGDQSDLAWACGSQRESIWPEACLMLSERFRWKLPEHRPWKKLPTFAGQVAFLPAFPNVDPKIELDVLTPHHKKYYESKDPQAVATDTEEPIPVLFPVVKPQSDKGFFAFPLLPLRQAEAALLDHAKLWLAQGLSIFGIGAKTNAGYGWFDSNQSGINAGTAAVQKATTGDYDEKTFPNQVIALLSQPQKNDLLKKQIETLKKPENDEWRAKVTAYLNSPAGKEHKKRLKKAEWFPQEWLQQEWLQQ